METGILWHAIFFFGALVQGATGFGFALVVTPLMVSLVAETRSLILLVISSSLFLSGLMSWTYRKHIEGSIIRTMVPAGIAGSFLGSYLLRFLADLALFNLIIALAVITFSLLIYFGKSRPIRHEKLGSAAAGLLSGISATLTSFGGPPVVLLLANQRKDPLVFKGTISLFFFIKGFFSIAILMFVAGVEPRVGLTAFLFIPVLLVGWMTGVFLAGKISVATFRLVVLMMIMAASLRIIYNTLYL